MTTQPRGYKSILGFRFGIDAYQRAVSRGKAMTHKAVDATISISAEAATVADQRNITITLKDANGNAVDEATVFEIMLFSSAAMTDFVAAGGSTGIAAGASGKVQAIVAKKLFRAITTTAGVCEVIYTDTGTDAGYLAVRLPNGNIVPGGVITNA